MVFYSGTNSYNVTTTEKRVEIDVGGTFPNFMELEVWVEAHNSLGREESERLRKESGCFGENAALIMAQHMYSL